MASDLGAAAAGFSVMDASSLFLWSTFTAGIPLIATGEVMFLNAILPACGFLQILYGKLLPMEDIYYEYALSRMASSAGLHWYYHDEPFSSSTSTERRAGK
jgi:hypothetical protein